MEEHSTIAARLRKLTVAAVYDALSERGYENQCMELDIRPLSPEMTIAGPAHTIVGGFEPRKEWHEDPPEHLAGFAMLESIPKGSVVLVAGSRDDTSGHWGELLSIAAQARGACGVVIDGATRDAPLLRRLADWPVFARQSTPIESRGTWAVKDFGVPTSVKGTLTSRVRVDPGDWIHGDEDGVVIIPKAALRDVLEDAENLTATEEKVRSELRTGVSFQRVYEEFERF